MTMADVQKVSKNTIHRVWQEHQLKPHLTKSSKLSRDPKFLEKVTDLVGVYPGTGATFSGLWTQMPQTQGSSFVATAGLNDAIPLGLAVWEGTYVVPPRKIRIVPYQKMDGAFDLNVPSRRECSRDERKIFGGGVVGHPAESPALSPPGL
jgi:hypothetical protein